MTFCFDELTDCVNDALINGKVPSPLKNASVILVYNKHDPAYKVNFWPVSDLPLLSKVFERLRYNQLKDYINKFINKLLY